MTQSGSTADKRENRKLVTTPSNVLMIFLLIDRKRLEKRERLHVKEQMFTSSMLTKQSALTEAQTIGIENLPSNYNQLMLHELVKGYPGLQDYKLGAAGSAVVHFTSHQDAMLALAGNQLIVYLFVYRVE